MDSENSVASQDGALESKKSAGKGKEGEVRRWLMEISLADKVEESWRKSANKARDIYRGKTKSQNGFNILWANTEVIRPNLYNSTPIPDVRRRYRDADPLGKSISEVIERSLAFESDASDFDGVMTSSVMDSVLPGRGTARVRFEPYYEETIDENGEAIKTLAGAKTYPERVSWDSFRRGPASCWEDVPWIAYEHLMTMDEVGEKFPSYKNKVQYDVVLKGASEKVANSEPKVFKRVRIWELWDKEDKRILWIAPSYPSEPLLEEEDKLKLKGFFDMPCPIYAVDDTSTLEPICEYSLYEEQAKELNEISKRINRLVKALKVRGIYDSTIAEMSTLLQADDNEMIPTSEATIALQAGGLEKAIWMVPIEQIAKVLAQLYVQREQTKGVIYEVIGISDILRGQSDPTETLGAQEIKAQSGSVRLQRRQREVQRFARDIFRIMSEIICEHYPPELLTIMSGIQVTPEMIQVMQRDLLRGIKIDVETDSTIAADQARSRKDVAEVMEAVGGFVTAFGPAVQSGAISMEAAKKILVSVIRKARLGREVEDAIDQDQQQPQQQKPDPEMQKMQAEMQLKQQTAQADAQAKQAESQANIQLKQQEAAASAQAEAQKVEIAKMTSAQQMQLAREKAQDEIALKREQMIIDAVLRREEIQMNGARESAQDTSKEDKVLSDNQDTSKALLATIDSMTKIIADGSKNKRITKAQDGSYEVSAA